MQLERIPTAVEMKVVALIARGDKYDDIRKAVKDEFDRELAPATITVIKKRNEQALATIKEAIVKKEKDDAQGLLTRAHRLLGKKLREAEDDEAKFNKLKIGDLTTVSKEMFHQVRIEGGMAEELEKLTNPKEKLKELQEILEENDEIRLERIVFAKRDTSTEVLPSPDATERQGGESNGDPVQGGDLPAGNNSNAQEV